MKAKDNLIATIYSKEVEEKCGLTAAIILSHIAYWIFHNRINNEMKKDGVYWMYQTYEKMNEYFPSLGKKALKTILINLEKSGYIKVGFFSDPPHHKTQWFTLTDSGYDNTMDYKKRTTISIVPEGIDTIVAKGNDASCPKGTIKRADTARIYNDNKANKKKQNVPPNGGGSAPKTELMTLLDPEPSVTTIGKDVNTIMDMLMELSPKPGHGDFAQRTTAEKLIKRFGMQACQEHIVYAKMIRRMPYGPVVKNIYDLQQKWYELEDFVARRVNEEESKGTKIFSI